MTTRDADAPAQTRPKRLRFDRYVLDLDRGCLLLDGNEIALRPKTFAVLHYLVENSGRLVSKDELFGAVWPNLAVTDDALVQSIGELRRALGDDGPRLIRTIPRRGYRFESAVSVIAPGRSARNRCGTRFAGFPRRRSIVESDIRRSCVETVRYERRTLAGAEDCSPLWLSRLCLPRGCCGPVSAPTKTLSTLCAWTINSQKIPTSLRKRRSPSSPS